MNCLLAGVGGQGTVLASKIIAQCAINRGEFVRTAETIGMAQRGGFVVSHVRIGEKIMSPLIPLGMADLIIALEPGEAVRVLPYLREGGNLVVNTGAIKPVSDALSNTSYEGAEMLAFLQQQVPGLVAVEGDSFCEALGSHKVLNLVLLGAAAKEGFLGCGLPELVQVIDDKIPEKFRELNKRAVNAYSK